jgi:chlorite dismutase
MAEEPLPRQYVNFAFYRVEPAWRRLPKADRERGKAEFGEVVQEFSKKNLILNYSLVGLRPDCDFMLWKISYELEPIQEMSTRLSQTGLGQYLTTPHSFLAMTKRSIYVDKHAHAGQEGKRGRVVPGEAKYLFVYPFVKSRDWYLLPMVERQRMMDHHIAVGHKFPSVKINTTYSFGLDDQDFVVAFESDKPDDFLDLVMALRETEGSKYTVRDTPIFTCVRKEAIQELLGTLG